jgi:hypothetical protein
MLILNNVKFDLIQQQYDRQKKDNDIQVDKILKGLELAYERLIAEKRAKNGELVILLDNKIVTIKP